MNISEKRASAFLMIARLCMASLFFFAGAEKLFKYSDAVAFAGAFGVPWASILMPLAIVFELGCATALLTRRYCQWAALLLACWTFGLNLVFHQFWKSPDSIWQFMVDNFFHSFVMIGGLLYVVVFGAGHNRARTI